MTSSEKIILNMRIPGSSTEQLLVKIVVDRHCAMKVAKYIQAMSDLFTDPVMEKEAGKRGLTTKGFGPSRGINLPDQVNIQLKKVKEGYT